MATEAEVVKALAAVMPLYANYRPPSNDAETRALGRAWFGVVGHLDAATLARAVQDAARSSEFFPTPALVLKCAADRAQLTAGAVRSGLEAWGDVVKAIAEHGYYRPPEGYHGSVVGSVDLPSYRWAFKDVLVLEVVNIMGWPRLCFSENQSTDASQFARAYDAARERRDKAEALGLPAPEFAHQAPRLEGRGTELVAQLAAKMGNGAKA